MREKKLKLVDLKVHSFVTEVSSKTNLKGGSIFSEGLSNCGGFTCYEWCTDDPTGSGVFTLWDGNHNHCGPPAP